MVGSFCSADNVPTRQRNRCQITMSHALPVQDRLNGVTHLFRACIPTIHLFVIKCTEKERNRLPICLSRLESVRTRLDPVRVASDLISRHAISEILFLEPSRS